MRAGLTDGVGAERGGRGGAVAAALVLVMAGQGAALGSGGRSGGAFKAMASGPVKVWNTSCKVLSHGPLRGWDAGIGGVAWVSDFSRPVASGCGAEGDEADRAPNGGERNGVAPLRGRRGLAGSAWAGYAVSAGLGGLYGP